MDDWAREISLGIRYDHAAATIRNHAWTGPMVPNRNVSFAQTQQVSWNDITPKWDSRTTCVARQDGDQADRQ